MKKIGFLLDPDVVMCLKAGGVVVARTDTIYGILADAANKQAVERVFKLKGRDDGKSPIVLIASHSQMFNSMPPAEYNYSKQVWPGKVTLATPADHKQAPVWLHRGNSEFGYRMPDYSELLAVIRQVGALIAPSANIQSMPPARTIDEAYDYFGDGVDIYVDGGTVTDDTPSSLIKVKNDGTIEKLR